MLELFDNAVLLIREGDGHTSYLLRGESRTRDAIDGDLITHQLPAPNTVLPDQVQVHALTRRPDGDDKH